MRNCLAPWTERYQFRDGPIVSQHLLEAVLFPFILQIRLKECPFRENCHLPREDADWGSFIEHAVSLRSCGAGALYDSGLYCLGDTIFCLGVCLELGHCKEY